MPVRPQLPGEKQHENAFVALNKANRTVKKYPPLRRVLFTDHSSRVRNRGACRLSAIHAFEASVPASIDGEFSCTTLIDPHAGAVRAPVASFDAGAVGDLRATVTRGSAKIDGAESVPKFGSRKRH
jgi:hypothetical protein